MFTQLVDGSSLNVFATFGEMSYRFNDKLGVVFNNRRERIFDYEVEYIVYENDSTSVYRPGVVESSVFRHSPKLTFLYSPSDKHNLKALVSFWGNRPSFADNYQTLQYELHSVPYTSIQSTELSYFWQPNDKWNLNVNVFANIIGGVPSRHLDSLDSGGTLIHFHAFKEKRTLFWITDLLINFILM